MAIKFYDPFTRTAANLGTVPSGPAWVQWSGTWETTGSRARCTSAANTNPKAVIPIESPNSVGRYDVDVSAYLYGSEGYSLYFRGVDDSNWLRARANHYQTSYQYYVTEYKHDVYVTEYLWNYLEFRDWYEPRIREYYWRNYEMRYQHSQTSAGTWTMGTWSGYSNTGETTACRIGTPTYGTAPVVGSSGNNVTEYRWVSNGLGVGCAADKATYRKQSRSRSETYNSGTTSYQWTTSSTPPSGWSYTGNSELYDLGSNYWAATKNSTYDVNEGGQFRFVNNGADYWKVGTASTQSTSGNSSNDYYIATYSTDTGTDYWAQSASYSSTRPTDTYAGQSRQTYSYSYWDTNSSGNTGTRQAGPYTGYTDVYEVMLEKSVAGTITQLGTTVSGGSAHYPMRVLAIDDTINVYVTGSGTPAIIYADGAFKTTGKFQGIGGGSSTITTSYGCDADEFRAKLVPGGKVWTGSAWKDLDFNYYDGTSWIGAEKKVQI